LGYNYSSQCAGQPNCTAALPGGVGRYDRGSGALIEPSTGYKLIVGSQNTAADTLQWDPRDYPCNRTDAGVDCNPHCLYHILKDESERDELSANPTPEDAQALQRLLQVYKEIGEEGGMPNPQDVTWNEQGTPYDTRACETASRTGYWSPWLDDEPAKTDDPSLPRAPPPPPTPRPPSLGGTSQGETS